VAKDSIPSHSTLFGEGIPLFFSVPHSVFRVPRSKRLPNEPIFAFAICLQTKEKTNKVYQTVWKNEPISRVNR
jgi:hypothetical protein